MLSGDLFVDRAFLNSDEDMLTYAMEVHNSVLKDPCEPVESMAETHPGQDCQNTIDKSENSSNMNCEVDTIGLTNLDTSNVFIDESQVTENEYPSKQIALKECSVVLCRLSSEELNSRLPKVQTPWQLAVQLPSDNLSQTQSLHHPVTTCKAHKRGRQKMNTDFHTELYAKKLKISSGLRNEYKANVNRAVIKFRSLDRFFLMSKNSRKSAAGRPTKFKAKKFSDTKISDYFTHEAAKNKLDLCESATIESATKPFDAEIKIKIENTTDIDEIMKERNGISKDLRVCLINMDILGISSGPYIASEVERIIADYASFSKYPVQTKVMDCSAVNQLCQNVKSNYSDLSIGKTKVFMNSSVNLTSKTETHNVFTNSSRKRKNQKSTITQFFKTLEDPVISSSHDSSTNETAPIESAYNEQWVARNTLRHHNSLKDSFASNLQSDDLRTVTQNPQSEILRKALLRIKNEPDSERSLDEIRVVPDEMGSPNSCSSTNDERVNDTVNQSPRRSSTRPRLSVARLCCKTSDEIKPAVTNFSKNIASCETSKIRTTPKKGSHVVQRLEIQSNEECVISKTSIFTPETERLDEVLSSDDVTNPQESVEPSKDISIDSNESYSRKSFEKSIHEICSIIGVSPKSRPTRSLTPEDASHGMNKEIDQLSVIDKLRRLLASQPCPDHRDKSSADVGTKMSTELQIKPADSTSTIDLPIASDTPVSPESLPVVEPMVNTDKSKDMVEETFKETSLSKSEQNTSSMTERVADGVDADFNRENENSGIIYKRKCAICDQLFTSAGMLKKHLSNHFKDEDPDHCILCDQPLKNSVVQHYFKHCTLVVVCPTCNKVFKHKGLLKMHMINEKHGRDLKSWKCDVCSITCDTKEDLFLHVLTHSTTDLQDAYQAAKTKQQLQDSKKKNENTRTEPEREGDADVDEGTPHIVVEEKTKTAEEIVTCEPDMESFNVSISSQKSTEKMLICPCHRNHQLEIASGIIIEISTACQQCNMLFKTKECFGKHLVESKTCCENFENKTSAKIYCGSCGLVLHSLQEMHSHLEFHTQKQPPMKIFILCKLCRVMFYGMGSMFYTHWFNHCKDSKFRTDSDSFPEHMKVTVFNIYSVNRILTQYQVIADHVCILCKNPFYSEHELKKHFNTDTKTCAGGVLEVVVKERYRQSFKLMCSICNEEFSTKSLLDEHVKSHETVGDLLQVPEYYVDHTRGNRFVCKICKTTLNSAAECDEHSLKHKVIQEKFVCGICIVMFDDMDDFENHLSTHKKSLKKPISCQIVFATCKYYCKKCKLLFEDSDSLHKHCLDHDKSLLPIDTWNQQTSVPSTNVETSICETAVINESHSVLVQETAANCSGIETQINDKADEVVDKSVNNSEQTDCHANDATQQSPPNERPVLKPSFLRVKKLSDLIEQKLECDICKAKFASQYLLTHHRCDQLTSVPEIISKPAKEIFICQACGMYETTDPLQLRIHVMLHFPLDAYPKLNETWYTVWRLSTGKHHLKCKLCQNFQTPSIATLQEHFLVVHGTIYQPMFKCRMCRDFMTFDPYKIQLHERTHFVSSSHDELPNFIRNNMKVLPPRPGTPSSQIQSTSSPVPKLSLIYRCPICNNFECTSEQQLQAHYSIQHPIEASRIRVTGDSSPNRIPSSGSCSSETRQPLMAQIMPHQTAFGVLKQNGTPTMTMQVTNKPSIRSDVISVPRLPKPIIPTNQQRWRLRPDQNLYPYSCSLCFCHFLHEAEFLQHQQEVHPPAGVTTNTSNVFQCDLCNLYSMSVDQLKFHKRVQHGSWY